MLTHSVFDHATQRYVMNEIKQPANAFEWRRYVVEEAVRRGDKIATNENEMSRRRSAASSKSVEKIRETKPMHGIMAGLSEKASAKIMQQKSFTVYSKARSNEGKQG
jgi:hypothetical protein